LKSEVVSTPTFSNLGSSADIHYIGLGTLCDLICVSSCCQLCLLFLESITDYNNSQVLPTRIQGAEIAVELKRRLFCQLKDTSPLGAGCLGEQIFMLEVDLYYRPASTVVGYCENQVMASFLPFKKDIQGEQNVSDEPGYCRFVGDYAQSKLLRDWLHQCEV
jgi:hypothetical protein